MNLTLDAEEARIIGCLIEKEITTPDQYPLSLNALVNACNQKTNRDPVFELDESTVKAALDRLSRNHLVLERSGFGSRVIKYRHRLCNGDHNPRQFDAREIAVICELLLRGAQTPGELRARARRLADFPGLEAVQETLERLRTRADGPYVVQLPRVPGARESRFQHLFFGIVERSEADESPHPAVELAAPLGVAQRLERLEAALATLSATVEALKTRIDAARGH